MSPIGYLALPSGQIVPKPLMLWKLQNHRLLLPLYFILSIAWALELVTHLEELAFWLFLLHQGPGKREWFYSWEFRTWCIGSFCAVLGMPMTTLATRGVLEMCEAYIFLVGSSAGTTTTLCFLYVLFRFPGFIKYVKAGGAEPDVVVRLSTFYQLNRIRVAFRFLFTLPLLIIAIDAMGSRFSVVTNPFALDFLLMVGGVGCFVSSAITLLVFFPRSFTHEAGYKAKVNTPQISGKSASTTVPTRHHPAYRPQGTKSPLDMGYQVSAADTRQLSSRGDQETTFHSRGESFSQLSLGRPSSLNYESDAGSEIPSSHAMPPTSLQVAVNRQSSTLSRSDLRWEHEGSQDFMLQPHLSLHTIHATTSLPARTRPPLQPANLHLHPYVLYFTSPIDLVELPARERRIRYP